MTAEAVPLRSDEQRREGLEKLMARWEWLGQERWDMLAALAHPSLRKARREALGGECAEAVALAADLRACWVMWDDPAAFPELTCASRQDVAAELAADRAAELLYALLNGESEQ